MNLHNLPMGFHQRLGRALKDSGLKQVTFAARIGVSGPTVSEWMSGKSMPLLEKVPLICNVLNVPAGFLFSDLDEEGSALEIAARQAVEEVLRNRGPRTLIAALEKTRG